MWMKRRKKKTRGRLNDKSGSETAHKPLKCLVYIFCLKTMCFPVTSKRHIVDCWRVLLRLYIFELAWNRARSRKHAHFSRRTNFLHSRISAQSEQSGFHGGPAPENLFSPLRRHSLGHARFDRRAEKWSFTVQRSSKLDAFWWAPAADRWRFALRE